MSPLLFIWKSDLNFFLVHGIHIYTGVLLANWEFYGNISNNTKKWKGAEKGESDGTFCCSVEEKLNLELWLLHKTGFQGKLLEYNAFKEGE